MSFVSADIKSSPPPWFPIPMRGNELLNPPTDVPCLRFAIPMRGTEVLSENVGWDMNPFKVPDPHEG